MLGVAQQLVHRDQVRHEPLDLAERALVGQLEVQERPRQRPRGGEQRVLAPEHLVQPPLRRVREREQPQRLARRRAVDDDHVPVAGLVVGLEREQAEQLVAARRHGQLLGRDPVDAALHQHPAEPALHPRPVALELVLGLDLLGEQAVADVGRAAADRRPEGFGERVRGVGGEHDRARARRGAAAGGRGGDRRLADPALARVEDRPGRHRPRHTTRASSCAASAPRCRPWRWPGFRRDRAPPASPCSRRRASGPASRACATRARGCRRSACARASRRA